MIIKKYVKYFKFNSDLFYYKTLLKSKKFMKWNIKIKKIICVIIMEGDYFNIRIL